MTDFLGKQFYFKTDFLGKPFYLKLFWDNIFDFCQNSRWQSKFPNFKIFKRHIPLVSNTLQVQNLLEIACSIIVWDKWYFQFTPKFKLSAEIQKIPKFFRDTMHNVPYIQHVQNLLQIALFERVFKIKNLFQLVLNFKMENQIRKIQKLKR